MIGEPELDGDWGPAAPAEVVEGAAEGAAEGAPVRIPARPWRWVAAAVAVTSALWAVGLYAFGERTAGPEIRYRVTDDLCGQFRAATLDGLLGGLAVTSPQAGGRHPVLDWASCTRGSDRPSSDGAVHVEAVVELHKRTDPAAEFAVGSSDARWFVNDGDGWESVPGLGEEALVSRPGTQDSFRLRVRDGGAVFTIDVMIFPGSGEDGPAPLMEPLSRSDREALVAAAAEDARALMAALRTR
ncbi:MULTISPECIES: hypothetical protein [Streptomyces]|uniref:Uncharacterized protein n=1 Tax=Streptomyces spororaveus TaxID=284039 RepID=A0ABQ3TC86_9ACTN|nr:hypothetical protein [Streptomyces spororaveus]MCM9081538.1 hypothetical protein [Streptomyces spororaveus]GHI78029.1 hypothetical protein Sspor_35900 [Streptomyces spororaveus]